MNKFEVKDVHVSDTILNTDNCIPYRKINIQIDMKLEGYDIRGSIPTQEEIIQQLVETIQKSLIKKAFSIDYQNIKNQPKYDITINPTNTDNEFGYYKI